MAQATGSRMLALGGRGVQTVANIINGVQEPTAPHKPEGALSAAATPSGIVRVVDAQQPDRTLAHFRAHHAALTQVVFDTSGTLIVTACVDGQSIHVFSLTQPSVLPGAAAAFASGEHPTARWQLVARHLYTLQRGLTTTTIIDVSINTDSRWVAVSSSHGTTHVFPIAPRGGEVTPRTHECASVANTSRFQTSAGIAELRSWRERPPVVIQGALARIHSTNQGAPPAQSPVAARHGDDHRRTAIHALTSAYVRPTGCAYARTAGQLLVPTTLIALLILLHLALSGISAHGHGMRCLCAPPTTHMLSALRSLAGAAYSCTPAPESSTA